MKKWVKILIGILTTIVVLFIAAILAGYIVLRTQGWHIGTPREIQGTYQQKLPKNSPLGFGGIIKIRPYNTESASSGMPVIKASDMLWRKVGTDAYLVRGWGKASGMYQGGETRVVYYKYGNAIYAQSYKDYKVQMYSDPYYRTKKLVFKQ